jgi:hypothetical protein
VFGVANPVAGATYTWSGNAGGTASGTGNSTCTVSGASYGDKQVSVYAAWVINGMTCRSADASSMTATVVLQPPQPDIQRTTSNPTAACENNNFIVTNPNSLCNYEWSTNYTIVAVSNDQTSCTVTTHGPGDVLRVQATAHATAAGHTCSSASSLLTTQQKLLEDGDSANCALACRNEYAENKCWHYYRVGYQLVTTEPRKWDACNSLCTSVGKTMIYTEAYLQGAWSLTQNAFWTSTPYVIYYAGNKLKWEDYASTTCWCQNI